MTRPLPTALMTAIQVDALLDQPRTAARRTAPRRGGGGLRRLVALVLLGLIASASVGYVDGQTRTCTVTGKDRTSNSNGTSETRIYTKGCGTLTVSDATFKTHFASADVYAEIRTGHRYEFDTIGLRIPMLSQFPNITEAREVTAGQDDGR